MGFTITVIPASDAPSPGEVRTCTACHRPQPAANFHGDERHRRRVCRRCVSDQQARNRRRQGAPVRHTRFNARGDCWCNHCKHYRPVEDFRRHPSRPGKLWSYCVPCTREIDRERYARKMRDYERALAEIERRTAAKRRQQARVFAERRRYLQESILLLRRRGLTKTEIARLTDTSLGNLLKWERGEIKKPTRAACDRYAIVVLATNGFLIGEPVGRRRVPHPAMAELLAVCLPRVQAIPIRDSWKNGRRG
jgi:transcriptional regulator with XRE-family HTH domain